MSEEQKPMSIEDMERVMREIEEGEGVRPGVVTPPKAQAAIESETLKRENPLALKEFVNPEQLKKDVEFNVNDLDNAMMEHASMFVHYSNLARLSRRQFERMKAAMEILESRLSHIHREKLTNDGKKVTEASVEAAVKTDPRWWAAQQRLIDSRAIHDLANDSREAFMQRKDMLVQIGVDRRRERESQVRIMGAQQEKVAAETALERAMNAAKSASESMQEVLNQG